MAQTTPPSLTATPTPAPQRGDRATFSSRFDAFITWLITFTTQIAALATNVYNNAVDAYNSAVSAAAQVLLATTQADNASASAATAAATASASAWVSGTSYLLNQCAISQVNFQTYRRKIAGAGATDPSSDPTNWVAIGGVITPCIKVLDQKASGTAGGTSVAADITQTRALNTTAFNSVTGASLASNTVTLPAGTYDCFARVPGNSTNSSKGFLYNISDSTYTIIGSNIYLGNPVGGDSLITGRFTISSTKNFSLRHFTSAASVTTGLGSATSSGQVEVYTEAEFWKVA